jgi:hypothetical protein
MGASTATESALQRATPTPRTEVDWSTTSRSPTRLPSVGGRPGTASVHVTVVDHPMQPGVNHDHQPSGRWPEIQADTQTEDLLTIMACKNLTPEGLAAAAESIKLKDKPLALAHFRWWLRDGHGANFDENNNLVTFLNTDTQIVGKFRGQLQGRSGRVFKRQRIEQEDYGVEDFQFAWGAIDFFDYLADFDAGTFQARFMDRYEWHPVFPGIYPPPPRSSIPQQNDVDRPASNCFHAGMVELKTPGSSAKDYWMTADIRIDLKVIMG